MILDGRVASEALFAKLKEKINFRTNEFSLVAVQVGDNLASSSYIRLKQKKAEEFGLVFSHTHFSEDISQEELESEICKLNADPKVGGIIIQLPLPEKFDSKKLLDLIAPEKDIDCLGSQVLGKFFTKQSEIMPATVRGVLQLLEYYKIDAAGKDICIIGNSDLVGKPLAVALTNLFATVTLCHVRTKDLKKYTKNSDIVISAVGKPELLTEDYFSPGQTVIDIGVSKNKEEKLVGDVDFQNVSKIVENITPTPGGTGPMTIYGLIENFILIGKPKM